MFNTQEVERVIIYIFFYLTTLCINGKVIEELDSNGNVKARNIWGDKLLYRKDVQNRKDGYYFYNGHGDVVKITDGNGNTINTYDYDIWGNITSQTENMSNPFKYAGEIYDEETGYYYLRARYYDPSIGRFITEDTYEGQIDNPLSLNLYTYTYNNPLIYVDQTGNVPQWLVDVWNQLKYEHRSVESTLSYWTLGMTDPFYTALRSPITSQEYWIAFTEATLNTGTMIMGGTLVKQGTSITVKITVTKGTSEATSLYRAVGPYEFYEIMETGKFNIIPNGMQAKQFGLSFEETLKFAEKYSDIGAIIEVKVPKNMLDELADFTQVDGFIFKNGTITIQVDKLDDFNNIIKEIIHKY